MHIVLVYTILPTRRHHRSLVPIASLGTFYLCRNCQWVREQLVTVMCEQVVTVIIYCHCIWYGRWRANFGGSGHALRGNWLLLFLMMFLYFSVVRSSYIIIVSGMGDDVPIWGALVTLYGAIGYCCFWWCLYTSVWSDHHISSLYLVWEMTCQFGGLWWRFWRQWYLLNMVILWSEDLVNMAIWSTGRNGQLVI